MLLSPLKIIECYMILFYIHKKPTHAINKQIKNIEHAVLIFLWTRLVALTTIIILPKFYVIQ